MSDRGVASLVMTVATIFMVAAAAGLGWGARAAVADDPSTGGRWLRRARLVSLVALAPATGLVIWLTVSWRLKFLEVLPLIALFAICGTAAIRSVQSSILISHGRLGDFGLSNIAMAVVTASMVGGAYVLGWLSLATVLLANCAGLAVHWLWVAVSVRTSVRREHRVPPAREVMPADSAPVRSMLVVNAVAQTMDALSGRLDLMLVAAVADARTLGLYSVAAILPQVAYFAYLTLTQRSYAVSPALSLQERSAALYLVCMAGSLPLAAVGGGAAVLLIEPVFGREYDGARTFLWPAMVMTIGMAALIPTLLGWQRGGRSVWMSAAAISVVGAVAAGAGAVANAWWAVTSLGVGLILVGTSVHVISCGWRGLIRGHRDAWKVVLQGA